MLSHEIWSATLISIHPNGDGKLIRQGYVIRSTGSGIILDLPLYFQLPLFIVENGFGAVDQRQADGTVNDHYRIDYFASHIREMKKAVVEDGVDLIGYTPWGCIDLVSAGTGEMKKRYGMIYVDKDNEGKGTLERIRKASFYWYRDLIANNGENI